jgi:hypothetical protein
MGHEYAGIVEEVGSAVSTIKPGQFVVGSFFASDDTCQICPSGYQPSCPHKEAFGPTGAAQAERMRVPLADGTLVATPEVPSEEQVPHFLATSDVLGTGWFAAVAAEAGPGKTVVVVGDGAVGLLGVLAARERGAERIIAISRNEPRQQLALEFGATDIVTERGDAGVAVIKDLTGGLGAHSVIEAVGTQESMMHPGRRPSRLCRSDPRRRPSGHGIVLLPRPPARRTRPSPPLSTRPDGPRLDRHDPTGQGLRPRTPTRPGRRRIQGHGRTPRHQSPASPMTDLLDENEQAPASKASPIKPHTRPRSMG